MQRTRAAARRPVSAVSEDKTRFIRFAKAGCNKGERSQMVTSGLGFGEEERCPRVGETGAKGASLRPGTGTVTKKGLTGKWA